MASRIPSSLELIMTTEAKEIREVLSNRILKVKYTMEQMTMHQVWPEYWSWPDITQPIRLQRIIIFFLPLFLARNWGYLGQNT